MTFGEKSVAQYSSTSRLSCESSRPVPTPISSTRRPPSRRIRSTVSVGPYGTDPFTVRATADALYVANQGANTLSVIDPSTLTATATIATGDSPYGIAVVEPPPTNG